MVGGLLTHDTNGPEQAHELYQKLKLLMSINYEEDCVQTLKALCLMSCWSVKPSSPVNLDGPWIWTGLAIQLVTQMGLHREGTYATRANSGCLRRVFWYLLVACWGRPPRLRQKDLDVRPPTLEDFEVPNMQSLVFIETTKLCTVMTRIAKLYMERHHIQQSELSSIDAALCDWVNSLPEDLRLYNANDQRKAYYRPASELFIQYFVVIVMSQMLRYKERDRPWRVSVVSRIAASCASFLYDEILCREETVFLLPNHGFFCLAISLPLICHYPQLEPESTVRKRDIAIVCSVLNKMRDRYGDADMVLEKMRRLRETVERSSRVNGGPDAIPSDIQGSDVRAKELFPFPLDMCREMNLLESVNAPDPQHSQNTGSLPLDEHTDNPFFGLSFMDFFEPDPNMFDFTIDSEPNAYSTQEVFS
ncbi:acetamidase regulatory protein, putative [Talaromyces stipitatus ATCC 10500]|uniref:Acetamidase regulatory protein, putative n=1 Tax=Talaromyces stipitatus (strain ATCC 10500 / CBS 375.48 / QM 6759 / NRRL 1006) TaxID=441959 RepID=B8LVY4_TALSN|nr:acetamidase regulatory protein, putative [Talaromyces stipitatus ATCC 10500]EED24350.1 acetamidase regulatory protein, putative [Talaromyces stipitatus ATCC 10500]